MLRLLPNRFLLCPERCEERMNSREGQVLRYKTTQLTNGIYGGVLRLASVGLPVPQATSINFTPFIRRHRKGWVRKIKKVGRHDLDSPPRLR